MPPMYTTGVVSEAGDTGTRAYAHIDYKLNKGSTLVVHCLAKA